MSAVVKIIAKPRQFEAIKWENNEPEVRAFILDDDNLRINPNGNLRIWNKVAQDWQEVLPFYYVAKGAFGELFVIAPMEFANRYDLVE